MEDAVYTEFNDLLLLLYITFMCWIVKTFIVIDSTGVRISCAIFAVVLLASLIALIIVFSKI